MRNHFLMSIFLLITISTTIFAGKVAMVASNYHASITQKLLEGANACLQKNGIYTEDISIALVPGSFEIPLTVKLLAETHRFDAIICVDGIATFDNPQWSILADHVLKSLGQLSIAYNLPISWGIFLFDSLEQAQELADQIEKNKGWQAAQAAIAMTRLAKQIKHCAQSD